MNKKQTSPKMAKIGSQALKGKKPITKKQEQEMGGSLIAQARGKAKKKVAKK